MCMAVVLTYVAVSVTLWVMLWVSVCFLDGALKFFCVSYRMMDAIFRNSSEVKFTYIFCKFSRAGFQVGYVPMYLNTTPPPLKERRISNILTQMLKERNYINNFL